MAENVSSKRPAIIASSQSFEEEIDPVEQEQVNRSDVDMDTNINDHSMSHASQTSGETDEPNQVNPIDVSEESMRRAEELEEMSFDAPSTSSSAHNSRRSSLNSTTDSTGSDQSSGSGSSSSRRRRRRRSQSTDGDDEL